MRRVAKRPHREEVRAILQGVVDRIGFDVTESKFWNALWKACPREDNKRYNAGWNAEWSEQKNALLRRYRERHAKVRVVFSSKTVSLGIDCDWCAMTKQRMRGCMICAAKRNRLELFIASYFWSDLRQKMIEGMPKPIAADLVDEQGEWEIVALLRSAI